MPNTLKVFRRKRVRPYFKVRCFYNAQYPREIPMQYVGIKLFSSCAHSPVVVVVYVTLTYM